MYLVDLPVDYPIHANVLTLKAEEHNQVSEHINYGWSFAVLSLLHLFPLTVNPQPWHKALCVIQLPWITRPWTVVEFI